MKTRLFVSALTVSLSLALAATNASAATVLSTERVTSDVRKVMVQNDDGSRSERFEMCNKESGGWVDARFDEATKTWQISAQGRQQAAERRRYVEQLERDRKRFERTFY